MFRKEYSVGEVLLLEAFWNYGLQKKKLLAKNESFLLKSSPYLPFPPLEFRSTQNGLIE